MTAKKTATAKSPAKKKTTKKKTATAAKTAKAPVKKTTAKKKPAAKKPARAKKSEAAKKPEKKAKSGFSSADVNMGHVFSLRPRVATSFRPDDFRLARQQLEDESFKTAADAAQAVVEKALELSHGDAVPGRKKHHRRF